MTGYNSQAGVQTYGPWTYPIVVGPPKVSRYEDTFEVTRGELMDLMCDDRLHARQRIVDTILRRGANR